MLENIFLSKWSKEKAGVAFLIENRIDFQPKIIKKGKEGHFIFIKGKIHQDELSILNMYVPYAWDYFNLLLHVEACFVTNYMVSFGERTMRY